MLQVWINIRKCSKCVMVFSYPPFSACLGFFEGKTKSMLIRKVGRNYKQGKLYKDETVSDLNVKVIL